MNLAYRWFCRLGLEGKVPDQSTFSKTRYRRFRDNSVLRDLFETIVAQCTQEGLVEGQELSVHGSPLDADASRERRTEGKEPFDAIVSDEGATPSCPVIEYLQALDSASSKVKPPKYISQTDPLAAWTVKNERSKS